jgi:hypothetical protein
MSAPNRRDPSKTVFAIRFASHSHIWFGWQNLLININEFFKFILFTKSILLKFFDMSFQAKNLIKYFSPVPRSLPTQNFICFLYLT